MTNNGWRGDRWWVLGKAVLLGLVFSVALVGCGGANLAPVSGKVSYKGEPVKGGSIVFTPVAGDKDQAPGKAAGGEVKEDGTYTLSTNGNADGAKVGHHTVSYAPPVQSGAWDTKKGPPPFVGLAPKVQDVEVKSGPNTIDIELVKK